MQSTPTTTLGPGSAHPEQLFDPPPHSELCSCSSVRKSGPGQLSWSDHTSPTLLSSTGDLRPALWTPTLPLSPLLLSTCAFSHPLAAPAQTPLSGCHMLQGAATFSKVTSLVPRDLPSTTTLQTLSFAPPPSPPSQGPHSESCCFISNLTGSRQTVQALSQAGLPTPHPPAPFSLFQ